MDRLEHFVEWMNGVEDAIADLDKESVSYEQYKDTLNKFEVIYILHLLFWEDLTRI